MTRRHWDCEPTIGWMFESGRLLADPKSFISALGARLQDAGAPVSRLRLGARTIHPQTAAWSVIWASRSDHAREHNAGHNFRHNDEYIGSPVAHVIETGTAYRNRLTDLREGQDHKLLFELARQGATDYLALPLKFSDGTPCYLTAVSDAADGFDDRDIAQLQRLASFLVPVFEVFVSRRMAKTLLETYVGRRTGERVLAGQIKRGDGELIHAAIWFSDLRAFTHLSETLAPADLLGLLNNYFEFVTAAVTARGGEVLRYIGDAMLIVFPVTASTSLASACIAAVDAATDAFDSLAAVNSRRSRAGQPEIRFGVGLHVGEVLYGNVGAPDRLDFTVMGPAVNRAARLEGLTKSTGHGLLMSGDVAGAIGRDTVSLGLHDLRGIAESQEVFALNTRTDLQVVGENAP